MAKKLGVPAPIGFGRTPIPDEAGQQPGSEQPTDKAERQLPPPLVVPKAIGDLEMLEILARYDIHPLVPLAKLEYQLLGVIAALEQRIRELAPDAE